MMTKRVLRLARLRGWLPTTWKGWALVATGGVYLAGLGINLARNAGGEGFILVANVALLALAPGAFVTLAGLVHWGRLRTWGRIGMVLLLLSGWFVPPLVLLRLAAQTRRARRAEQAALRASLPTRIAELERELGLDRQKEQQ